MESNSNILEYWSIDELDKEELPHKMLSQIRLDKTPPNGLIQINNAADSTTSTSVTLTLTATDATSGIYQVRSSNDGVWNTEEWETYKLTKTWKLTSGDGEKTVYYQIMDNAGLISPTYSDTTTLTSLSNSNDSDPAPSPHTIAESIANSFTLDPTHAVADPFTRRSTNIPIRNCSLQRLHSNRRNCILAKKTQKVLSY